MVINDHFLKQSGLLPSALTGKLSDFAFMFFAPVVMAAVLRVKSRWGWLLCCALPALLLILLNSSEGFSEGFASIMSHIYPMRLWPDPTDLFALATAPLAFVHMRGMPINGDNRHVSSMLIRKSLAALTAAACIATSPARPPTHTPVYMSWEEFRTTAVSVGLPRPIEETGKLVVTNDYLFLNEPNRGVHIIDNRDPENPKQMLFIEIPGNLDIAVEGDLLIADSFVDLLTFKLDLARGSVAMVERLEDQFEYDPYQTADSDSFIYLDAVDRDEGVVIELISRNAELKGRFR